jgi:hypothetical protein
MSGGAKTHSSGTKPRLLMVAWDIDICVHNNIDKRKKSNKK